MQWEVIQIAGLQNMINAILASPRHNNGHGRVLGWHCFDEVGLTDKIQITKALINCQDA